LKSFKIYNFKKILNHFPPPPPPPPPTKKKVRNECQERVESKKKNGWNENYKQ
jgi:hypothetical protein